MDAETPSKKGNFKSFEVLVKIRIRPNVHTIPDKPKDQVTTRLLEKAEEGDEDFQNVYGLENRLMIKPSRIQMEEST